MKQNLVGSIARGYSLHNSVLILSAFVLAIILAACGGGGTSGGGGGGGGQVVGITITPTTKTLGFGESTTFSATVTNTSNTAVSWLVVEGNTGGTVTSAGVYTAPNTAGTYHVVVTSQADTTKSATAVVTVSAPVVGITISPTTKTLGFGESTTFSATVTNTSNTAVSWLVVEGNTGGTVTSAGVYTAPNTAGTYHVTVTSQADATKSATAVVTVSGPAPRTVSGTSVITFRTTDTTGAFHTTNVPQNASSFALAALVPNGTGGFTNIAGTGSSDGSYSIANVPSGYFWLTDGSGNFIWTQKSTMDTGFDYIGDSAITVGSAGISLGMSGASPWQTSDFAYFYSPNTGTYKRFFTSGTVGSTSLNQVINLNSEPLLDSTKGDYAIVYQLVHHTVTGGGYKQLERFYGPQAFSTPNGILTVLSGTFTQVTASSSVRGYVKASEFATFTSLMGPGATNSSTCLGIQALPSTADAGFSNAAGDVILADDCKAGTPILTDTDLGDISYGNPYPSNWPLFSEFVHVVSVPYSLPGTTTPYNANAANFAYNTTLPTSVNPVVPLVGPVLNPTIAAYGSSTSTSLQAGATGVGTSPVITWQVPTVGTPTEYAVTITLLANSSGTTTAQTAKTLWVSGGVHSIQVPPGVMTSGKTYFIGISAIVGTGVSLDPESYPYRRSLPYGQSDVLSGLITP